VSLPVDKGLRKAQICLKVGEVAEAVALYKQILSKFPKNKRALEGLRQASTVQAQGSALRVMPSQDRLNALADLYHQRRFHETERAAYALIETFPNVAILYNILGLAKAGLAQYDAAITCYRRALELAPGFFETLSNIGDALKQKGDLDGAIDSFKQALKIKPDQVVLYRYIGKAQIEKGAFDQAIEALQTALRLWPDFGQLHSVLGTAFLGKGDWQSAINSCQKALKTDPSNPRVLYNMGSAQHRLGWFEAAIDS
jgi:protein O-GlcNAc transferase